MWADYYPDCLPPATYIGIGSPTGVKFGTRSNFPENYRHALYAMDWSYGRIIAVHLTPSGATYTGKWEPFVQGTPLNLTSLAFGRDGAMYFITGGRGTQSGLYRVTYEGAKTASETPTGENAAASARKVRHALESFHTQPATPAQLAVIENQLLSSDRSIQYAARVALECQDPEYWLPQKLTQDARLDELLPAVRVAENNEFSKFIASYIGRRRRIEPGLANLRVLELIISRSELNRETKQRICQGLERTFPANSWEMNRELSRILLFLDPQRAIAKSIRLLENAPTQEQQLHYIEQLRNVREGWNLEERKSFFKWFLKPRDPTAHPAEVLQYFKDVGRSYVDGAWFDRYLRDFRRQAIATLTPEERKELEPLLSKPILPAQNIPANNRTFVRSWKMEDLLPELGKEQSPNLGRGRQALVDAQCLTCHRFGNDGGMAGPELTGVGSKYSARDILESIIEPSKVLSDQYQNHTAILKDGDTITGRLVSDSEKEVVLETDRLSGTTDKIPRSQLANLVRSPLSPMPEGLANVLTKEEILDLIAYVRAGVSSH
jgi:putative heme-binding domain-containing protein